MKKNISKFVSISKRDPKERIFEIQKAGQAKFDEGHTLTFPSPLCRYKKFSLTLFPNENEEEEREVSLVNFYTINNWSEFLDDRFRLFDGAICLVKGNNMNRMVTKMKLRICGKMKVKCLIFVDFGEHFSSHVRGGYREFRDEKVLKTTKRLVQNCNLYYHEGVMESKNIEISENTTIPEYFSPAKLNVIFGSLENYWGFSFDHISSMYWGSGRNQESLLKYLWEDHHYLVEGESGKKVIVKIINNDEEVKSKKGTKVFHELVLKPVYQLYNICTHRKVKAMKKILTGLGKSEEVIRKLETSFKNQRGRGGSSALRFERIRERKRTNELMEEVFPLYKTLNESIIRKLPTSKIANRFRADIIYKGGSKHSRVFESIYHTSPHGNLYMLINEVVYGARGECIGFGRVFSGTLFPGMEVNVFSTPKDSKKKGKVKGIVVVSGRSYGYIEEKGIVGSCGIVFENSSFLDSFSLKGGGLIVVSDVDEEKENYEVIRLLDCVSTEHNISTEDMKIRICIDRGGVDLEFEFLKIFFL